MNNINSKINMETKIERILTLPEVAPYLSHELSLRDNFSKTGKIRIMSSLGTTEDNNKIYFTEKGSYLKHSLDHHQPLLIPAYTLATNRKLMAELINCCYQQIFSMELINDFELIPGHLEYGATFQVNGWQHGFSVNFGGQKDFYFSSYKSGQTSTNFLILDKLALFRILYKHHIDVDDLIDAGLALNKLDYTK